MFIRRSVGALMGAIALLSIHGAGASAAVLSEVPPEAPPAGSTRYVSGQELSELLAGGESGVTLRGNGKHSSVVASEDPPAEPPAGTTRYVSGQELTDLLAETQEDQVDRKKSVTVSAHTTDGGAKGGRGHFIHQGDRPLACDTQGDGYRVRTTLYWSDSKGNHFPWVEDANGNNGDCMVREDINIPEGTDVTLKVCLKKSAKGEEKWCGWNSRGVA